jgi:hypothetical protein
MGVAVFEPHDAGIPAPEVPASAVVTRQMKADRVILQREYKFGGGWLPMLGYVVMFGIAMLLLGLLAWGIQRISRPLSEEQQSGRGLEEAVLAGRDEGAGPRPSATPRLT